MSAEHVTRPIYRYWVLPDGEKVHYWQGSGTWKMESKGSTTGPLDVSIEFVVGELLDRFAVASHNYLCIEEAKKG